MISQVRVLASGLVTLRIIPRYQLWVSLDARSSRVPGLCFEIYPVRRTEFIPFEPLLFPSPAHADVFFGEGLAFGSLPGLG